MKPLIKTTLGLIAIFLLIFLFLNSTGLLTQDDLAKIMRDAENWPKVWIGILIIGLLISDIAIPVPGIIVVSIGGYFLGPVWGAFCGSVGLTLAGMTGYLVCRKYGYRMLRRIYRNESQLAEMKATFDKHSTLILLLCRALPMFPEAASCLAGATQISFWKFLLTFGTSCTIYSIAVAYAGSLSSAEDLSPALIAYLVIMIVLWSCWALFIKAKKSATASS